jgi:hypothetical protein
MFDGVPMRAAHRLGSLFDDDNREHFIAAAYLHDLDCAPNTSRAMREWRPLQDSNLRPAA